MKRRAMIFLFKLAIFIVHSFIVVHSNVNPITIAKLFIFPEIGHAPAFEIPDEFHAELIRFLSSDPNELADQEWRQSNVGRN